MPHRTRERRWAVPAITFAPVQFVSIPRHVADGYVPGDPQTPSQPAYVFRRDAPGDDWLVAGSDLLRDPIAWFVDRGGSHVRIPLVPYVVPAVPERLFGFAWQLALAAAASVAAPYTAAQLVLGSPSEDLTRADGAPVFRVHAGLALKIR